MGGLRLESSNAIRRAYPRRSSTKRDNRPLHRTPARSRCYGPWVWWIGGARDRPRIGGQARKGTNVPAAFTVVFASAEHGGVP